MATAYGPSIVRDGLVLCLDAANPKSLLTSVEVLVVAGGGGGGGWGGGGGGGGLLYSSALLVTAGTAYSVTVGAGGAPGTTAYSAGGDGGSSVFSTLSTVGGGGGGYYPGQPGRSGGSGGGGGGNEGSAVQAGGAGTAGQGFAGGTGNSRNDGNYWGAGGGGGAGVVGQNAVGLQGGRGGDGLIFAISGTPTYYAGGGGGHTPNAPGTAITAEGGLGGGGAGGRYYQTVYAVSGTANTGGGGGGSYYGIGAGGSGIVIVRYFGPQRATGGTITSVGGYTIHTFTTVGSATFTPNATWSDLSGNANSGTLTDGPTYSSANGGYIAFNGTSNYITNSTNLFSGRTTTTGAYWVYITAYPSGNVGVLHMWNGVSQLAYDTTSGGIPQFWINGSLIVSGNQLSLNTWYYMTWVTDGAFARIYTNGVLVNSGAFTAAIATSAQPMYIFRRSDSAAYMAGRLSSLSVYNRALSAAEIQQNFNAHRGRYGL